MVGPNLAPAPGEQIDAAASSSVTYLMAQNQAENKPMAVFSKLLTVAEINAIVCRHNFKWGQCTRGCCIHHREQSLCRECGGSQICIHGRQKSMCKECGGSQICSHGGRKSQCKECGGSEICSHGRLKSRCKDQDCKAAKVARQAAKAAKKAERG